MTFHDESKNDLIHAGGLWKNTSKNGNTYLSGNLGGLRLLIFPVKERTSDKSPHYNLCVAPNVKRRDDAKPAEQIRDDDGL